MPCPCGGPLLAAGRTSLPADCCCAQRLQLRCCCGSCLADAAAPLVPLLQPAPRCPWTKVVLGVGANPTACSSISHAGRTGPVPPFGAGPGLAAAGSRGPCSTLAVRPRLLNTAVAAAATTLIPRATTLHSFPLPHALPLAGRRSFEPCGSYCLLLVGVEPLSAPAAAPWPAQPWRYSHVGTICSSSLAGLLVFHPVYSTVLLACSSLLRHIACTAINVAHLPATACRSARGPPGACLLHASRPWTPERAPLRWMIRVQSEDGAESMPRLVFVKTRRRCTPSQGHCWQLLGGTWRRQRHLQPKRDIIKCAPPEQAIVHTSRNSKSSSISPALFRTPRYATVLVCATPLSLITTCIKGPPSF